MRLSYVSTAVAIVLTVGCPYTDQLLSFGGGRGSGGGTGSDRLVFIVEPTTATHTQVITPPIEVQATDSLGNPDTTFALPVTVALAANPNGAVLGGTLTVTPSNAVALFGDLTISVAGSGYILQATAPGARSGISGSFTIK